jgi:hypothetical protein
MTMMGTFDASRTRRRDSRPLTPGMPGPVSTGRERDADTGHRRLGFVCGPNLVSPADQDARDQLRHLKISVND